MKLQIGYSPCPNDTFIFDAMVHGKVDTEGLSFEVVLADVEELNHRAFAKTYPISKLSYHALALLQNEYTVLDSGSALGEGIGPLLITTQATKNLTREQLAQGPIAIPGKFTTAAFLLKNAYPEATNLKVYVFDEIENALANNEVLAGVIIHENRFTYADRGFALIKDLGEYWEEQTQLPIPLGGIAVRKDVAPELREKLQRVLHRSIVFAFENPEESRQYVADHAQEMSPEIQRKHIETYVNAYSLDLGERGRAAIQQMFSVISR